MRSDQIPLLFFCRRLNLLVGIFSLSFFIAIHFTYSALLSFGSQETVQTLIEIRSLPVVGVAELVFVVLPLFVHLLYMLARLPQGQVNVFQYPFRENRRYLFKRVAVVFVFCFVAFHLYQTVRLFVGGMRWEEYLNDIFIAQASVWATALYGMGLWACVVYFACLLPSFLIDFGIAVNPTSQRLGCFVSRALFFVLSLYVGFMVLFQIFPNKFQRNPLGMGGGTWG